MVLLLVYECKYFQYLILLLFVYDFMKIKKKCFTYIFKLNSANIKNFDMFIGMLYLDVKTNLQFLSTFLSSYLHITSTSINFFYYTWIWLIVNG